MIAQAVRDESLFDLLAKLARRSSDTELLAATAVGLGGALAVALFLGPSRWSTVALFLALGAFGGWGITDREMREREMRDGTAAGADVVRVFRALRFACGAVALLAAFALVARAVSLAVGYWKS